ncbi:hypothetical protein ACFPT7_23345 [Acidicapsa dinghuensis]|uniref:Uncharacterized protein n=1 Tax=Acidicapsa dinghuensis TaxID=2218256 RepID=A0ABW1EMI4_9BACT|nr:hypothetical protein [Acidicapsa dinghuensis]
MGKNREDAIHRLSEVIWLNPVLPHAACSHGHCHRLLSVPVTANGRKLSQNETIATL